jgi:hypothetical protein
MLIQLSVESQPDVCPNKYMECSMRLIDSLQAKFQKLKNDAEAKQ